MLPVLVLPAILPAFVGMVLGLRLGKQFSRRAILVSLITFVAAFIISNFTSLEEPISGYVFLIALFFSLGISGPAIIDDGAIAAIISVMISIAGACGIFFFLYFVACGFHGKCV